MSTTVPDVAARPWHVLPAPPVPDSPDAADAWAFAGIAEVARRVELARWGWDDLHEPVPVLLGSLRPNPYRDVAVWVAVTGDGEPTAQDVVGYARALLPLTANTHTAEIEVAVRPDHESRGIGSALLAALEDHVRAAGRTTTLTWSGVRPEPEPGPGVLTAPTGTGRVPADARAVRFALARGYALEQVERYSVLELPGDPGHRADLLADARARAGGDYRTHTWHDELPADRLDDLAELWTRMSTDVPLGGLDLAEDRWDAERVRGLLERMAKRHQRVLLTAAEHVPTGRLAAFTWLQVPVADVPFAFQADTLVLHEHRGHRLGMLVKGVNLDAFTAWRPGVRRIHTWNAQENDHMLAINVALGFRQAGVEAALQRAGL
ncbi:GNAT family N-acetyltransferase [Cellulomonas shaoxiangyii]|uniref:GNAT family N-acetyltransferase n=1 Tax=Cellulomonas shaoxiangyii TaxID=2566013 RepID=A0A4P7SLP5_9CELL|nr:GNAT family N-acetyltransferase [Cellulomonas shaoxiangyii]QCB94871.1 GNAT family N-acetyltransferase [Cellulomonas shaoxiangyii]TGY85100.1 GNAT family N-acetyltransferase [Cellulomonas shaoxiangyii]